MRLWQQQFPSSTDKLESLSSVSDKGITLFEPDIYWGVLYEVSDTQICNVLYLAQETHLHILQKQENDTMWYDLNLQSKTDGRVWR